MELNWSWLYGATQGPEGPSWECPACGDRVWIGLIAGPHIRDHESYHCDGRPKSSALVVTR